MEDLKTKDEIQYSNTTLVREDDGKLSVWVDGVRMLGTINVQMLNGDHGATMVLGLPSSRLRFGERAPQPSQIETKDNVIRFSKFAEASHKVETDPNMVPAS